MPGRGSTPAGAAAQQLQEDRQLRPQLLALSLLPDELGTPC